MRALIDYATPIDTKRLRRRHIAQRVGYLISMALFAWSAHTLVMSIVDANEKRVAQQERAARSNP